MTLSTWMLKISTLSDLHQARDDDSDESDDFGVGEEVLHPGAPFHIGAVHKGQQTWKMVLSHENHMHVLAENSSQHVTICTVMCRPAYFCVREHPWFKGSAAADSSKLFCFPDRRGNSWVQHMKPQAHTQATLWQLKQVVKTRDLCTRRTQHDVICGWAVAER